ncbi:MAG: hypothetical protein D3916_05095 [Candidatus Electrothrix sp. MAN1_4]|nr:hypothetical protein [Candidatus Electrothrix sp. MAN1_4]
MNRRCFRKIILSLVLLMFLPVEGYSGEIMEGVDKLRHIFSQEGRDAVWDYLDNLPAQSQHEVALLAAADSDNAMNTLGIIILVQSGYLDEAIPALSAKVAAGDDLSRFGYSWLHSDEPNLVLRMYLKISRDLLVRLDSFTPEQRVHIERFFRSERAINSGEDFSPEVVEQHLEKIEARIKAEQHKEKGNDNAGEN